MTKNYSKEIKIGIAAIICLILLYVGIEFLKGVNLFKPGNYYNVKYENVTGLAISAPVTINGFKVGQVRDITYDHESGTGMMNVQIGLDKSIKIPEGSKAILASDLLGTASIQIKLNTENRTTFYKDGATIDGEYTSGLMGDLDTKIMPNITTILPKLDSILSNINEITGNKALKSSIDRLDNITANLEETTKAINKILASNIPATLDNVNSITKSLDIIANDLTTVSNNLKEAPIDETLTSLNNTMKNIETITNQLNSKNSSIGLLLNDRGFYDHLNSTITDLDSIMIDLRHNPKKYVNFKLF